MSIDRLRYFAAVVETRNLRRASELVGISPPSMSKAISVLEGDLDCKLIYPEGRGIGITERGLEIYRRSTPLLEEHRRFFQGLKTHGNESSLLRIATFEVFSSHFLAEFISSERQYDFLLLEMTPGRIEEAVLAGTVDYGITYLPSPDPVLEHTVVGSFKMGIYGKKEWSRRPFEEWPFAIPTTELKIHTSEVDSLDMWPKEAPRRKIKHQFELLETALQTSSRGATVVHCPDFVIRLHNERAKSEFHLSPLPYPNGYREPKPIKTYLASRKGAISSELGRKLAKRFRLAK
jgi:DNA-binding transcriptional LysR family regulator